MCLDWIGIIINDYLRPQHFHSLLLAAASCSLLGNNQRNELHSIIFTALHTKISTKNTFQNVHIVLKYNREIFRRIIPEKYRYFSGKILQEISWNFQTPNPSWDCFHTFMHMSFIFFLLEVSRGWEVPDLRWEKLRVGKLSLFIQYPTQAPCFTPWSR